MNTLKAHLAADNKHLLEQNAQLSAELDRIRAENAELREIMEDLLNLKQGCHERADAILARTTKG